MLRLRRRSRQHRSWRLCDGLIRGSLGRTYHAGIRAQRIDNLGLLVVINRMTACRSNWTYSRGCWPSSCSRWPGAVPRYHKGRVRATLESPIPGLFVPEHSTAAAQDSAGSARTSRVIGCGDSPIRRAALCHSGIGSSMPRDR